MSWKTRLSGIIAPVTTPFDTHGRVDLDALEGNLRRWLETDLVGFAILGSTGEFPLLTRAEKLSIFERARAVIPAGKVMIAGTGCESTAATVELTRQAAELGADLVMVVTPSYYGRSMTSDALAAHYRAVAAESPVPVLLYNVPVFTHVDLDASTVVALAGHERIVGIKDSSGNMEKLEQICSEAPQAFAVMTGAGGKLLDALSRGATGAILGVSNVIPDLCAAVHEAHAGGRQAEAERLQAVVSAINTLVPSKYGVPGVKALLDGAGWVGGAPRRPLLPLSSEVAAQLRREVESLRSSRT